MKYIAENINISKIIWVYVLLAVFLFSTAFYIFLILDTAVTVSKSNDLRKHIASTNLEIGELEGNSLKSEKRIDLELASSLGFDYVKSPQFLDSEVSVALVN